MRLVRRTIWSTSQSCVLPSWCAISHPRAWTAPLHRAHGLLPPRFWYREVQTDCIASISPIEAVQNTPSATDAIIEALKRLHNLGLGPAVGQDALSTFTNAKIDQWKLKLMRSIKRYSSQKHRKPNRHALDMDTLQNVLATHLSARANQSLIESELTVAERCAMRRLDLGFVDIVRWSDLLMSNDPDPSILPADARNVPAFVIIPLLRRWHIGADLLTFLALNLHTTICRSEQGSHEALLSTLTLLLRASVEIMRHARNHWPESLETMVKSTLTSMSLVLSSQAIESPLLEPLITFMYNELLIHLAVPSAVNPYRNSIYQQAAQNAVLQEMSAGTRTIVISAQGYRAVQRVQLSQAKTHSEQTWAVLKSPTWPPWKKDRTRMDSLLGPKDGTSRAAKVASKACQAGFAPGPWQSAAMIYAGWDTDQSPTLQTRAILPDMKDQHAEKHVWAARIRSTRTLQESWACFQASRDAQVPIDNTIYLAMLEKIQLEQRRKQSLVHADRPALVEHSSVLPGDAKEVLAPPRNSQYETHTRTSPASMQQLKDALLSSGVAIDTAMLSFLVTSATSIDEAIGYLQSHTDWDQTLKYLLMPQGSPEVQMNDHGRVITALVRCLSNNSSSFSRLLQRHQQTVAVDELVLSTAKPLVHAYRLATAFAGQRSAVNVLLQGLSVRRGISLAKAVRGQRFHYMYPELAKSHDKLIAAKMARALIAGIQAKGQPLDAEWFKHLCQIHTNSMRAARQVLAVPNVEDKTIFELARTEVKSNTYLSEIFASLVGVPLDEGHGLGMTKSLPVAVESVVAPRIEPEPEHRLVLPRLHVCPGPAVLHAYVRALGACEDFAGILSLTRFITMFWPEIETRMAQDRNGKHIFRRFMIATRSTLQEDYVIPPIDKYEVREPGIKGPEGVVKEVKLCFEGMPEFGGWPSAEEVAEYRQADHGLRWE